MQTITTGGLPCSLDPGRRRVRMTTSDLGEPGRGSIAIDAGHRGAARSTGAHHLTSGTPRDVNTGRALSTFTNSKKPTTGG